MKLMALHHLYSLLHEQQMLVDLPDNWLLRTFVKAHLFISSNHLSQELATNPTSAEYTWLPNVKFGQLLLWRFSYMIDPILMRKH